MTKKQIREALAPLSKAVRHGEKAQVTELFGLRIECSRLYNSRTSAGFAWHPHFGAYSPQTGKMVTGGNLSEITERLALYSH